MTDDEKAQAIRVKKINQVKELLLMNRADSLRADRFTPRFKSQVLMQLRVEREMLEHQLLLLTDFKETEVAKILSELQMTPLAVVAPVPSTKPKDEGGDDGKELVHAG